MPVVVHLSEALLVPMSQGERADTSILDAENRINRSKRAAEGRGKHGRELCLETPGSKKPRDLGLIYTCTN